MAAGRPKKSQGAILDTATNIDEVAEDAIANDPDNITFDYKAMGTNFNAMIKDIEEKLTQSKNKLRSLLDKEDILNKMINTTNTQMETTPKDNYKLVGTYQSILLKQFESLQMWQEAVMKYEDLIQRYMKMRLDIENHKLTNFTKIKNLHKAGEEAEEGFDNLLKNMHKLTASPSSVIDIQAEAQNQLRLEGY
jgi:hypothetical protein